MHTQLLSGNKQIYGLIVVIWIFFGASCTEEKKEISYKANRSLEPRKVLFQGSEVYNPSGFIILDSILVVTEEVSDLNNDRVKIFRLGDFGFLDSFGRTGNGPDEFSNIIQPFVATTQKDKVQFFDWSNKRLDVYEIGTKDNIVSVFKSKEYTVPPQLMLSQKSVFINDTTIISSGGLINGFVSFTDINSDESKFFDPLNHDLTKLSSKARRFFYESDIAVNFNKNLIVVAPRFIPQLYIINFHGDLIASHTLNDEFDLNNFDDVLNKKGIFYGISLSDQYIYAAYVGKSITEMDVIIEENDYKNVDYTDLYKFNWQGEFLESYKLLNGSYRSFSIDESHNRIFSLDMLTSEIVYFEIN